MNVFNHLNDNEAFLKDAIDFLIFRGSSCTLVSENIFITINFCCIKNFKKKHGLAYFVNSVTNDTFVQKCHFPDLSHVFVYLFVYVLNIFCIILPAKLMLI